MLKTAEKPKYRQLENGQYIRLIKNIENNGIKLEPMMRGKIVQVQNNVEANIWFFDDVYYNNELQLDTSFYKNGRFEGVVLNVKADSFAIKFDYNEHTSILIPEEKALKISFFEGWEEKKRPSSTWKRVGNESVQQSNYLLADVIDYIDDAFKDWVEQECKKRKVTDEEKESGELPEEFDWVFTDEAQSKFSKMQEDLELEFAEQSGFYYHFLGGTIEC